MKKAIVVLMGFFLITTAAQAYFCDRNYRHDSYGLGLGDGFLGLAQSDEFDPFLDPVCYRLGVSEGKRIAREVLPIPSEMNCRSSFNKAKNDGLVSSERILYSPSDCSNAGYNYGQALLDFYARFGRADKVGNRCVSEYRRGKNDGKNNMVATMDCCDNKLNKCYLTGYDDGMLYRDYFSY
ncbi:MAG: hypothetical protein HQK54_15985 [Oligoflexales bacterium]|nr:hypothetical protein [Oligoflexales bacterium]